MSYGISFISRWYTLIIIYSFQLNQSIDSKLTKYSGNKISYYLLMSVQVCAVDIQILKPKQRKKKQIFVSYLFKAKIFRKIDHMPSVIRFSEVMWLFFSLDLINVGSTM